MARVQTEYDPGAEALRTTAAPNIQAVQARFDPNASSAYQLAAALGKAQPMLQQWSEDIERKKLQEQLLKVESYKETFKNAKDGVSATQVGQQYPDMNPIVRARVTEGVGADYGRQIIQPVIQEISQDDNIRLDNGRRKEFVDKRVNELIGQLGGDEFYKNGAIAAIKREINQYENTWTQQTAVYHQEVQKNDFRTKVGDALRSADPATALENLDTQWKGSSSLNNLERNKEVVNTAIDVAFTANSGVGDPTILDKIPDRFLNDDSKNKLNTAKQQILERAMVNFRRDRDLKREAREENVRNGKIEIIGQVVANNDIDPAKYRGDPELWAFAMQMKDAARLPETVSVANAQRVRMAILDGSTIAGMDAKQVIDQVMRNPALNPRDKQDLIKEVPKLLEGRIAMDDPMVKNARDAYIEPTLKQLESSTNFKIQGLVNGGNLRTQAMSTFDIGLRTSMDAWYKTHGSWPTGLDKQKIVDDVTKRTQDYIQNLVKIGGGNTTQVPAAAAPAPAPRPAAPAAPAVGTVVRGFKFKGGDPSKSDNWEKVK